MPVEDDRGLLEHRLLRELRACCAEHRLIRDGDRVLACLSGGKDSWALVHLLALAQRQGAPRFELTVAHLDQRQPGYDGRPLVEYLRAAGLRFEILQEDTYAEVVAKTPAGAAPCAKCSSLRRGILYTAAERLGANVLALGHHREDTLETFLLNVVFTGKLQAMPAGYVTDDGRFRVIRPLIATAEADLARFAALQGFPILPCTLCGARADSKREAVGALLSRLEALNPRVRESMLAALGNVRPTHLLDPDVAQAWAARPAELPAKSTPSERPRRFAALPVLTGGWP